MRSATIRGEAIPSSSSSFTSDHSESAPALEQYATEFSVGGRARATSPLHYTSTLKPSAVNQPSRARVGEKSSFPADFVGADRATRPPGEKVMDQPTLAPTTNSREGGVRASVFQGTPPRERREGNDENSPQLRGGVRTSPLTQRTTAATTASTATSRVAVQKPHPNGTASTPAAVTRYRDPTSHDAAAVTTVPTSVVQREWPANASGWAEQISLTYLTCSQCSRIVVDPVQMRRREHQPLTLACRQCARNLSDAQIFDLPSTLHAALMDILERSGVAAMGGATAPQTESAAEAIAARRKVYAKRTTPGAATTAGAAATSFPTTTTAAASLLAKGRSASDLLAAEGDDRTQISLDEAKRREMMISSAHRSLRLSSAASPSSRQLKLEADKRYEDTEYTAAVELYTKAILRQPEDGLTQLRYLYGNRSAALFMAQQYEACVADCLAAVEMEPTNTKMRVRAARSAAMMGDLRRAISILEAAPPQSGSESLAMDLAKYKDGLENLIKAEKLFGTTEGDERYRMLSAQFPDTTSFRLRYAESLAKQRQYHLAIETLSAVAAHFRTPPICLLLARCLYLSGFAQFETAIKTLEDASQLDADCAALLERIRLVDEHKENGNNYFKRSMFAEALDQYTLGIKRADDNDQVLHILYCNRAAAAKELGRYREAVEDCTKALELNADFFKAYARRARCHILLGDNFAAVRDFKKAMEIDDSDNTLAKDLREAEANLAKEGEKDKDYYYQLGLTRSSSEKDIKTKFRELSLRWHPDKCVNLDETEKERAVHKFKLINEAYGTLSDPAKRREYDLKTDRERLGRNGGYSSSFSNFSNDPYFRGSKMKAGNRGYW